MIFNKYVTVKEILKRRKREVILVVSIIILTAVYSIVQFSRNNAIEVSASNFIEITKDLEFCLGGEAVGIKILSTGVLVMGVDDVSLPLKEGDIILKIDDTEIESNSDITEYINMLDVINRGKIRLEVDRDGNKKEYTVSPKISDTTGKYELGIFVKDSSAGIGIVSFYEKTRGLFAALGHRSN